MLLEQADRDRPQCARRRGHLGEDVNTVLIFFDHPLQAAHLAFDPAQPLQIVILVLGVSVHAALRVLPPLAPLNTPPWYIARTATGQPLRSCRIRARQVMPIEERPPRPANSFTRAHGAGGLRPGFHSRSWGGLLPVSRTTASATSDTSVTVTVMRKCLGQRGDSGPSERQDRRPRPHTTALITMTRAPAAGAVLRSAPPRAANEMAVRDQARPVLSRARPGSASSMSSAGAARPPLLAATTWPWPALSPSWPCLTGEVISALPRAERALPR